ncbi:MAG: WcbI family polysaccharide biosynthesis putative acetyltransferase [Butyrivibrio sp.]
MHHEISNYLKEKNIILFGVNDEAIEFYQKFHDIIHIDYCVTSYSENVILQPMKEYGVDTILYDNMQITDEDYIVICDSQYFQSLERRLQTDGIEEYKQYISSKLARGILEEKKLVMIMGSECLRLLARALETLNDIMDNFFCIYYAESELLKPYKNRMAEYQHVAKYSNIYILSICDKAMYKAKVIPQTFFDEECLRISISDYTFKGYYPQISTSRDEYSSFLFRERERFDIPYYTLMLAKEDCNLRDFVYNNVPVDEIVERVSQTEFYSENQVQHHFTEELNKIRQSDAIADIKLAKFIDQYCRHKVGYRNLDEWNVIILRYVLRQVLNKMGLEEVEIEEAQLEDIVRENSGSELPVYPSVLHHLGIDGYDDKKYKVVNYYQTRYMNFREYIKCCAECMYQIKELREFLGIEEI